MFMVRVQGSRVQGSGFGVQVSGFSPAVGEKTVSLIEKETLMVFVFATKTPRHQN